MIFARKIKNPRFSSDFRCVEAFSGHFLKFRQNLVKIVAKIAKFRPCYLKICEKMPKFVTKISWNIEVWAVQKHVNLVDLVKSFPTNIYLQKSASIQPRTSRSKFGSQITLLITYRASCSCQVSCVKAGRRLSELYPCCIVSRGANSRSLRMFVGNGGRSEPWPPALPCTGSH